MHDFQLSDHLDGVVRGLRDCGREPGKQAPGGFSRVEGVGLAIRAPQSPVKAASFDVVSAQERGQRGSVGAGALDGALDAEREDPTKPFRSSQ
ncbi:hypothetical protein [Arthrobacter sp. CAN_C5]|uniref:hypothetical protein n=1 Tax=Arthrobacter sp. CAN_C5 TaxID=2760706 RepID=UPI001AE452C5|nr:hypothetical protein [Arthrobacter sp. CAN_C5]MBP2216309.1 hypothetical protein [Arthrobacter sp. CAN_C5]